VIAPIAMPSPPTAINTPLIVYFPSQDQPQEVSCLDMPRESSSVFGDRSLDPEITKAQGVEGHAQVSALN
jgi:hypothetical protein